MSPRILILFLTLSSLHFSCNSEQATPSRIDLLEKFSSDRIAARNISIWLPENYSKNKAYAVLYMHDGQMLFDSTQTWNKQEWGVDETAQKLIDSGQIRDCIVVGIDNGGPLRHAEYFPQKPFESLPEALQDSLLNFGKRSEESPLFSAPVQSDAYLKFLVEELKPYIDQNYASLPDRANTFIAGSSMGGLISMYAFCEYPEIFGGAACLSTHWPGTFSVENNPIPGAFIAYLSAKLPEPDQHRIYFDYGTETLDALYEPFQLQVDSVMRHSAYDEKSWKTLKFPGADHSERAWRARLEEPLIFLLGFD